MRVLIFDDGYHEDTIITESREYGKSDTFMQKLGKPHTDLIEIKRAYIGDVIYYYNEIYKNFTYAFCEAKVEKIFNDIQNNDTPEKLFNALFNKLWSIIPNR